MRGSTSSFGFYTTGYKGRRDRSKIKSLFYSKSMIALAVLNDRIKNSFIREYTEELGQGNQLKGLGETGEVYIVNKDKLMITESRFIKDAVFKQVVDTEGVRAAFENGEGMTGIYPNYIGIPILGVG